MLPSASVVSVQPEYSSVSEFFRATTWETILLSWWVIYDFLKMYLQQMSCILKVLWCLEFFCLIFRGLVCWFGWDFLFGYLEWIGFFAAFCSKYFLFNCLLHVFNVSHGFQVLCFSPVVMTSQHSHSPACDA